MVDLEPPPRLLLVEGQDDRHVVRRIVEACGVAIDICIREAEGVDRLLDAIPDQVAVDEREVLGILVDANGDPGARWTDVIRRLKDSQILQAAGIQPPDSPAAGGLILAGSSRCPRTGIWMMPDNAAPGELEDFVRKMIPEGDPGVAQGRRLHRRHTGAAPVPVPQSRQSQGPRLDGNKKEAWPHGSSHRRRGSRCRCGELPDLCTVAPRALHLTSPRPWRWYGRTFSR